MVFYIRVLFTCVILPLTVYSQNQLPYKAGEHSTFNISFRGIKVGSAELKVLSQKKIDKTATFHIIGTGKTSRFFDVFFKVRDVYETYLDTLNVRPKKFLRDIYEGGYQKKQQYSFKHSNRLVFFNDTSHKIVENTQDMLSALFFARTFNKELINKKKSFVIPIFMDDENYFLEVSYLYNEKVKTNFGTVNCMVFKPKMQEGRVFQDGEKMKVWISEDRNRLLIKVETQIWAGSIKAIITDFKELKYPLSISK